jgi:hypothetical protein
VSMSDSIRLSTRRPPVSEGRDNSIIEYSLLGPLACLQEFGKLPLRLSRQVTLRTINEGLNFIASSVKAKLQRGLELPASGAVRRSMRIHLD